MSREGNVRRKLIKSSVTCVIRMNGGVAIGQTRPLTLKRVSSCLISPYSIDVNMLKARFTRYEDVIHRH